MREGERERGREGERERGREGERERGREGERERDWLAGLQIPVTVYTALSCQIF